MKKGKISGLTFDINHGWLQNGVPVERNGEHLKKGTSQVQIERKRIPTMKAASKK